MTIQEKRWMDMDNLRALCIRHGWFTRGDCKAYDKFLNMPYDAKGTQRNITTTNILLIEYLSEIELKTKKPPTRQTHYWICLAGGLSCMSG